MTAEITNLTPCPNWGSIQIVYLEYWTFNKIEGFTGLCLDAYKNVIHLLNASRSQFSAFL